MQVQIRLLLLFDFFGSLWNYKLVAHEAEEAYSSHKSFNETIVTLNLFIISSAPMGRASYKSAKEECGRSF